MSAHKLIGKGFIQLMFKLCATQICGSKMARIASQFFYFARSTSTICEKFEGGVFEDS